MKYLIVSLSILSSLGCSMLSIETKKMRSIIIGDSLVDQNEWDIFSIGYPGEKISYMTENLPDLSPYHNVYILMGMNNLGDGQTKEQIKSEMDLLIERIGDKNITILSITPIDNYVTQFTTNQYIDEVNELYKTYENYINIHDILSDESGNSLYSTDGVHLNQEAYIIIENIIYDYL